MKKYLVPASALAVVAALVSAPLAASASTIPDGQAIYGYADGFYSVNSTNAALTPIGSATSISNVYGMDYSPQDGVAYFFDNTSPCDFYSLDITTGIETYLGPIVDGLTDVTNCDALDVALDGTVYLGSDATIYEIDSTDGSVAAAHVLTGDAIDGEMAWLATDPTTGILYMGDYNGNMFSVNTTTWVSSLVASDLDYIESGDFDANGTFWFSGDGPDDQALRSFLLSDPTAVTTYGEFADSGSVISVYAIFIAGAAKPALAATGSDVSSVALGAGILLLAGLGALLVGRRRATS